MTTTVAATITTTVAAAITTTVAAAITTTVAAAITTTVAATITTIIPLWPLLLNFRLGIRVSFAKDYFSGEFNTVVFINSDDFDFDNIANLANFFNLADEFVFKFADMAKAIAAGKDFNKGTEVFD
jgi:hypothetical protein